jgi:hypothetical protein
MRFSISSAFNLLFAVLLFPALARAADPFCVDANRVICNQKQIVSDLGVSTVAGGFARVRKADRAMIKQRAMKDIGTRDLKSLTGAQLSEMARLLHVDNWRCYFAVLETCRTQIADRIAEYASREVMLFDDESSLLPQTLTLREIERLRALPAYKTYRDWMQADSSSFRRAPTLSRQLREMFPGMVQTFIAKVRSWPVPEPQKSAMIRRLQGLTFVMDGKKCAANDVPAPYVPNGVYTASTNQVEICSGLFIASSSPASLAVIVAHEIAHAVGPCFAHMFSPGAAVRAVGDPNLERIYGGLLSCLEERTGPRKPTYCDGNSKVNEAFADWAGTEIVAEYLPKKFPSTESAKWRSRLAGSWSFSCGAAGDGPHPATTRRFNEILFANPSVRTLVNCPRTPSRECRMGSPLPGRTGPRAGAGAVK